MVEHPHQDDRDIALDRLLGEAKWPEPAPEQLVRLRDEWRRLRRTRRQRYFRTGVAVAAAASVAIVAISFSWRVWRKPTTPIASPESVVRQQTSVPAVRSAVTEQSRGAGVHPEAALVREPNLYERVVLSSHEPARRKRVKRRTTVNRTAAFAPAGPNWAEWLDEAALLTPVELARWSGELVLEATRYHQRLWTAGRLQAGRLVTSAVAAVRHAQAMARDSSLQVRAVEALVQQADLPDLVSWLVQEPDRKLRRRLLVELVLRGTDESVGAYLAFVARPECRREALAAMADVKQPPTSALLAYLGAPNLALRNAAALVLAMSTDPEVIHALASLLDDASRLRPALVALLLNRTPQAAAVVNEAREDLYLVASVRAAEFELQRVNNTH